MKEYQSHKVVLAAQVSGVAMLAAGLGAHLKTGPGALEFVEVDEKWLHRHTPQGQPVSSLIGGYVVSYPGDGYLSWSPAEAFETGYTEVGSAVAGLPVAGYAPTQSRAAIDLVNSLKLAEERALRILDGMEAGPAAMGSEYPVCDRRFIAVARTGLQQAFMAAARAVFQPGRIRLPEDDAGEAEGQAAEAPTVSGSIA